MTRSGTTYKQGDLVLVPFPFTDLSAVKQRPVLILSKDTQGEDLITCAITSNPAKRRNSIRLRTSDLSEGRLPIKSTIRVDKIFTLERSIIKKRLGRVGAAALNDTRKIFCSLV